MSPSLRALLLDVEEGLASHPARTLTSVGAIAAGVMMVTLLLSCLEGLQRKSERLIGALGANVIAVLGEPPRALGASQPLEERHAEQLRAGLPDALVSYIRRDEVPTIDADRLVTLVSTDERLARVRQWPLAAGRFLDRRDLEARERNVVISDALAQAWGWQPGQSVFLGNTAFTVVGVVRLTSSGLDDSSPDRRLSLGERVAFIPRTVPAPWGYAERPPGPAVEAIFIRAPSQLALEPTRLQAQKLLEDSEPVRISASWVTPQSLAQKVEQLRATIGTAAGGAALLCLLLGGITTMSIMLGSVRERVGEIGLRRALGARGADITALFIAEGAILSLLAGLLGTALGHVLIGAFAGLAPVPLAVSLRTLLGPVVLGVLAGTAFACIPARRAAAVSPIVALRETR